MKILCLHGMGTSAAVLEAQLGPIVLALEQDGHELVFIDGLLECQTDNEIKNVFAGPYLCYYSMPAEEQVIAAQAFIKEIIEEEGPFDGVIGFSQGAALAATLMLEHMKTSDQQDLFSFCVFIGASLPFDLDNHNGLRAWLEARKSGGSSLSGEFDGELGAEDPPGFPTEVHNLTTDVSLLGRYHPATTRVKIDVPTLHIIGEADPYKGQAENLVKLTKATEARVLYHKEGHCIPKDRNFLRKAVSAMEATLDRAMLYRH